MATSEAGQQTLQRHGVHEYSLGDLLRDSDRGSGTKLILVECPLCASDPTRPRYHFARQENRPRHFADAHSPRDVPALTGSR